MAKKDMKQKIEETVEEVHEYIQNEAPILWQNFDQFWNACVKNGNNSHKEACKLHLKSLGILDRPEKWLDGVLHFGIKLEK